MKFEVENFKSSYHAILRTPALANFLAVPHYVYLQLKMPGKIGVLSLHDDVKKSYDCDQMVIKYTSTTLSCRVLQKKYSQQHNSLPSLELKSGPRSHANAWSSHQVTSASRPIQQLIGTNLGDK